MLPLGVVIPTKNSMPYLQEHLANLSAWIDLAEQVVVVDSFSTDGTLEFLKQKLCHRNIRFVDHPPGLYASWNHGIREISSKYCYISTVGDSITRSGIMHLINTATHLHCDVLVSRPEFVNEVGHSISGPQWPLDEVIEALRVNEPKLLDPIIMVACTLKHTGGAMTGSCGSDLFLTRALQGHPFPTNYGTAGDGPWSMKNAVCLTWAVTPQIFSTFRQHPSAASKPEILAGKLSFDYSDRATALFNEWMANYGEKYEITSGDLKKLLLISIECEKAQREYNTLRKEFWPWILRPSVWALRSRRNRYKQITSALMLELLHQ